VSFHEVVATACKVVQFQRGLSEPAFERQYGTEEQCRAIVIASRWPHGFEWSGMRWQAILCVGNPRSLSVCQVPSADVADPGVSEPCVRSVGSPPGRLECRSVRTYVRI
jgi:hypothetical protein